MSFEYSIRRLSDKSWERPSLHFHDSCEVLFSLTDAGKVFVDSELVPLRKGTLCFFQVGVLHRTICNVEEFERYVLHFPEATFDMIADRDLFSDTLSKSHYITQTNDDAYSELEKCFSRLYALKDADDSALLLKNIAFLNLFYQAVSAMTESPQHGEFVKSPALEHVRPIMEYIQNNLSEPLSLDEISQHFFISKHYMCHLFKSATGFSITEYIIRSRLVLARKLLRDGCSVQSAGEMSGFRSNAHFIRTFGNIIGISPGKYAKEYRQSNKL